MMHSRASRNLVFFAVLGLLAVSLTGCGIGAPATAVTTTPAAIGGTIFGGQQPIVGAAVTLMAANTTGYGLAPSVLASTVSLAGGSYSLPSHVCPTTPDSLVYVEAVGGDSGSGTPNSAIDLVAIVGNCSAATSSTVINLNEATTVAAAYVLAPFANTSTAIIGIGTSPTNIVGLNNAAGPAQTLVNSSTGAVNVTNAAAGVVLPSTLVNTLADMLAACVNMGVTGPDNCNTLFNATNYGFKPVSTFAAALNIALHPAPTAGNMTALLGLVSSTAPFQPAIASPTPPNDFTLAIGYNGGGIAVHGVNAVAIDASGNAWVTDYFTDSGSTISGLIEITPTGTFPGGPTGFGNTFLGAMNNIAIDQTGTIWVDNTGKNAVTGVNPNGTLFSTFGANNANGIAIDNSGDIWYSTGGDSANTTFEITNLGSGNYTPGASFTTTTHFGVDVCIQQGFVYNINYGASNEASSVTQYNFASSASAIGTTTGVIPDGGNSGLSGCAVDNAGNLWLANFGGNNLEVYTPSLTLSTSIPVNPAVSPQEIALDGLGNVFVPTFVPQGTASYNSGTTNPASLVEFTSAGALVSPAVGYFPTTGQPISATNTNLAGLTSQQVAPGGVAIDASGNVWLTGNDGQSVPSDGNTNTGNLPAYVTEILGVAAPVITPKSVALSQGKIATRP
jgi:hypothetical protein